MAKKKKEEPVVEVTEEVKDEPITEIPKRPAVTKGKVVNCKRLFVRSKPDFFSPWVTVIDEGDIVTIDNSKSVEDFYAVSGDGFSGFCAAPYISVIY